MCGNRLMTWKLCAANEEDLRRAGLKMGDIIKIRTLRGSQNEEELNSSFSSIESDNDKTSRPKPLQETLIQRVRSLQ